MYITFVIYKDSFNKLKNPLHSHARGFEIFFIYMKLAVRHHDRLNFLSNIVYAISNNFVAFRTWPAYSRSILTHKRSIYPRSFCHTLNIQERIIAKHCANIKSEFKTNVPVTSRYKSWVPRRFGSDYDNFSKT
jgi:hypothetical protein